MNDRKEMNLAGLSPSGQQRREQILALAVREAGIMRRRRAARRAAGAVMVLAVAAGAWLIAANHHSAQCPTVRAHVPPPPAEHLKQVASGVVIPPQPPPPPPPIAPKQTSTQIVIDRIPTDPTLSRQLALPRQPQVRYERLSDDALLRTLADAGQQASLRYVGGKASVTWRQRTH
jgi:hypothetical protein